MKKILPLFAIVIALSACVQSNSTKSIQSEINEKAEIVDTLCFNRYSGSKNQDTAFVKLIIDGNKVSGHFSNVPYEKDARVGTVTGVKSGNLIKGMWHYQQEGINDSIAYEFKLEGNRLLQKQTNYDLNTGREILTDTAEFSVEFLRGDCQSIN